MQGHNQIPCDVCIAGAGISGLTLAYRLQKAGLRVMLFEKRHHPGGAIRTEHFNDFVFDQGPNSTLTKTPRLEMLIDDLGLRERVCYANEKAANRFILKNGRLLKLPASPQAFLKSDLLSWRGKLRIFAEPFIRPKRDETPESIAGFVRRRLGQEALDYLVNPFIAGVYAGDPEQIDLQTALPRLAELEKKHGSLIRGAIAKKRASRDGNISTGPKGRLLSFDRGMSVLAEALANQLGDALVLGAEVESILSLENRVEIGVRNGQGQSGTLVADKLILATPAAISARLIAPFDREAAAALAKIEYAPVAVGFHGYKKSDIRNPLDGFGFLIPEKENRKILGTIRSSTIFPGRAPEGYAALTTFVGGARQPELAQLPEAEIYQIIEDELRELLGVTGGPVIRKIKIWPKAIPQYGRRHAEILTRIAAFESAHPAIRVAGNFRKGVSVADCVDYAYETAEKIIEENHAGRQDERDQPEDTEARETAAALAAI